MDKNTASKGAFRARSGRTVRVEGNGTVVFDHANGYLSPESAMDAEEFFQAQRDTELGRWRWPQNPHYVVYPCAGQALVIDERTGRTHTFGRDDAGGSWALADAAEAYFEAHPERKREWADAQFITFRDGAYLPQTAQRDTGYMNLGWRFGRDEGEAWLSEDRLAAEIGDAEVTILVPGDAS